MSDWENEWRKFHPSAIEEIKSHNDDTHLEREWMSYVYEKDGQYYIGRASMGDESKIEIIPAEKTAVDTLTKGLTKGQRRWTIHGHPLKDGKIYNGRQYFSSTDLIDEFIEVRDSGSNGGRSRIVQYVVYPHEQNDGGQKSLHNRVRILVFPDARTIVNAMKQSNPHVDPMRITKDSGQNKVGGNGKTELNDMQVDWFKFQEALGRTGHMGIVDIEGSPTQKTMAAETATGWSNSKKISVSVIAVGVIMYFMNSRS
jgi:hypothetical protein